ncbi:DUF4367 domain-containing protein [Brevibacillus sp. FSL K6-0770]|uniref:DUF4367 domain-containing protein n=1 Tax=Brevibacillus sp. FSL K6-0770 TaxID=2954673 RepID=UPI0030F77D1A
MMGDNPYKQLHELLAAKPVPKVDVKQKVMAAIAAKKIEEDKKVKKKIGVLLTIGLLAGASSVWAGMEVIQLKNEKGEVVMEMDTGKGTEITSKTEGLPVEMQNELAQAEADAERRSNIINEILDQLKPGTSAAIYWLPKNEKKDENAEVISLRDPNVDVFYKAITYTSLAELEQKLADKRFALPTELNGAFRFESGEIEYKPSDKYDVAVMKAEAIKNKKEYVVKEIPTSDKFDYVHVAYRGAKGGITVEVRQAELGAKTGSNATGVEKVMLGKNEAALMTYKEDNQPDFHWIVWIKNGSDLEYSVRAKATTVSKEELIKLAKQLNEHK